MSLVKSGDNAAILVVFPLLGPLTLAAVAVLSDGEAPGLTQAAAPEAARPGMEPAAER